MVFYLVCHYKRNANVTNEHHITVQGERICLKDSKYISFEILAHMEDMEGQY